MKKFYNEFLRIPKTEKIRDKVMMTRISLSVAIMILCLGAMGITAYAYFSCNITSAVTTIRSAGYDLDVDVREVVQTGDENAGVATIAEDAVSEGVVDEGVTESNASENIQPVEIVPNEEGYYVFENVATEENADVTDKTYEFILKIAEDCTASVGFGKFEVLTDVNEDGSRQLYYTTPIGTYVEEGKTVENKEYKLQLLVPANKTVKVRVIAEWGTCTRESIPVDEDKQIPTLIPDFKDSKYMHISFDDVSHSLLRLKNDSYTSLYDESFFAWLKTLHDTYGAKFSLYTYINVLEQVPDTYKDDFAEAKDWIKIGLHAEDAASSYADVNLTYNDGETIWKQFAENVFRITGTYESVDRMPKLEESAGSKEVLLGMRDAVSDSGYKYGVIGFLVDKIQTDGQVKNVYYLNVETDVDAIKTLFTDDFYIDKESGFTFVSTDIALGSLDADSQKRQEQYTEAASMHSCIALLHEGQIYDENGFITDAEGDTELLKSQVEELCKFANSKGIKFNYPQTRDFAAIQGAKLAEKAAKEAAEKAADEKAAKEAVEKAAREAAEKAAAENTSKEVEQETAEKVTEDATTGTLQESVNDTSQENNSAASQGETEQGQEEGTGTTDELSQTQTLK